MLKMTEKNNIQINDVGAIIFSSTPDISSAFPAAAARTIGWNDVPLFGTQEIDNPDGLKKCIRVLILWNCELPQNATHHFYLQDAVKLRPDLKQN